jgi:SpoVK/Ycf46/Vps4 family AAA+-type ATPase
MSATVTMSWPEANQRYLMAALAVVREALERHAAKSKDSHESQEPAASAEQALREAASAMPSPPALETLTQAFGLSPFERSVLLLCAGMELDSSFAALCTDAQGDPLRAFPTFSLALSALPDAHWSALTPAAPLRRWRLIEVGAGNSLTLSSLRIDERILHYLAGIQQFDDRLAGIIEPLQTAGDVVPSHAEVADRIVEIWKAAIGKGALPAIQLCGGDVLSKRAIAMTACASLGLRLSVLSAHFVPVGPSEIDGLIRLWWREAILSSSVLLLECDEMDESDQTREKALTRFIESTGGVLILATRERRRERQRAFITFDVRKPTLGEQRAIWHRVLGDQAAGFNGKVEALISQFSLSAQAIQVAAVKTLSLRAGDDASDKSEPDEIGNELWDACRAHSRSRMESLAQKIEPAATWRDLVLPEPQRQILRDISAHVRQRAKVYDAWGFRAKGARGLGISALFAGSSGTGKTMAGEVLADELRLDLYRIDLSQVVSKYIGETEKNLRRVFDVAEEGGAILLFDEADALFGKRSEVKDSHDRYANIEVSYLLQRMETYRGLAILTTNMKNALDTAFLRRLRFIVQFPFPNSVHRAEIWRRIFPPETPTEDLDVEKLGRLNVAGGNIRNIALNAAFLAAEANEPVRMNHLLRAAYNEFAKLEKPLTEAEVKGWV